MAVEAALLGVDGTVVDSNYQHTLTWYGVFGSTVFVLPVWRIHRAIGVASFRLGFPRMTA